MDLKNRKETLEAQIAALRAEYEREAAEVKGLEDQEADRQKSYAALQKSIARMRKAD